MSEPSARRASTRVARIIKSPRAAVYRACLDPEALAAWRAPGNMTARIHDFDARIGGSYRMSLTYKDPALSPGGKTTGDTDTFRGRFAELVPDEKIVEVIVFESSDPRFAGEMTVTMRLADTAAGTEVTIECEDLPPGVRPADNEMGCESSLENLAALVERKD